jgi:hypothetical protein
VRNPTPCTSLVGREGRRGGPGRQAGSCSRPSGSLSVPPGWPPRCEYAALRASCTIAWKKDHGLIKHEDANDSVLGKNVLQDKCCGSVTCWYGSGSSDTYLCLTDTDAELGGLKTYGTYGFRSGCGSGTQVKGH